MPTIILTITLTVPEGTNFEVKTDAHEEPTVEVVEVVTPAIQEAEPVGVFHGEYGTAPASAKNWVGWWKEAEDELARDMTISDADLADCLGRTVEAVHSYRYHHGYSTPSRHRVIQPARRAMARWTDVEVVELLQLVGEHGEDWSIVGARLGRSEAAVKRQYGRALVIA